MRSLVRRQLNAPQLFQDHVIVLLPPTDSVNDQVVEALRQMVRLGMGELICDGWGKDGTEGQMGPSPPSPRAAAAAPAGVATAAIGAVATRSGPASIATAAGVARASTAAATVAAVGPAAAAATGGFNGRAVAVLKWPGSSPKELAAAQQRWGVKPVLFNWFMDSVAAFELQPQGPYCG